MLVNGIMIPTTAFLIEKFSVRRLFLVAMGLFTIGTITAGVAPNFSTLLLARLIQASGSAIMMPLLMNVLLTSFPVEKRGGAMGIFGLVMIFAPAIGPTLSGWLVEHYSWRMLFHIVTPIAALIFILAIFLLKDHKEKVNIRLDLLSLVLSTIGFGGLLYGFSSAGNKGWDNPIVYGTIIVGAVSLILFIWRQLVLDQPMLEFRIYKYPMFALSSVIMIVIMVGMFAGMLLLPIYLQNIRGITPLHSGLLMLPGAILMGIMSPITGILFDKIGAKILAIIGLAITIVTSYFFSQLSLTTTYTELIILYTLRMFGMSMIMMPVMTNGLNQLPGKLNAHGTAMNNTLQQVSGAIGSAFLVSIMSNRTETHAKDLTEKAMSKLTGHPSPDAIAQMKQHIGMKAVVEGINDAFLVSVGIMLIAFILVFFMKRVTPYESQKISNTNEKESKKVLKSELE